MKEAQIIAKAREEGWKVGGTVGYLNGSPLRRLTDPSGYTTKLTIKELGRVLGYAA